MMISRIQCSFRCSLVSGSDTMTISSRPTIFGCVTITVVKSDIFTRPAAIIRMFFHSRGKLRPSGS